MSLWDEFYRNLFLDRVEALVQMRMNDSVTLVLDELGNPVTLEADTFQFIW